MRAARVLLLCVGLAFCGTPAGAATITFDDLDELTEVTTQYAASGATFSPSQILQAGSTLNEIEFPPSSGDRVLFPAAPSLEVVFAPLVSQITFFTTYAESLLFYAYTADGALRVFGGSFSSSNLGGSEKVELIASGLSRLVITGATGSFVIDDLSFVPERQDPPVPAPAMSLLVALGAAALAAYRRHASSVR